MYYSIYFQISVLKLIAYYFIIINTRDKNITAWFLISYLSKDIIFLVVESDSIRKTIALEAQSSTRMISFATPDIFKNHVSNQYQTTKYAQEPPTSL